MRLFYEEWKPIINKSTLSTLISSVATDEIEISLLLPTKLSVTTDDLESFLSLDFTHHIAILNGEKDASKRLKYIHLSLANCWNTKYLQQQIKDNAADKYGGMPSNFGVTIKDSRDAIKALNMFKDEYLLDFINTEEIGIRDIQDIDERVVEKEIIHNIKKFIMTFGRDFAFVGNQYHLEAFSEDFFPDSGNGPSRWKQRAFYDYLKDLYSVIENIPVIRLSIYDQVHYSTLNQLIENGDSIKIKEFLKLRLRH